LNDLLEPARRSPLLRSMEEDGRRIRGHEREEWVRKRQRDRSEMEAGEERVRSRVPLGIQSHLKTCPQKHVLKARPAGRGWAWGEDRPETPRLEGGPSVYPSDVLTDGPGGGAHRQNQQGI
jgi:hypothetical protein